MITFFSFRFKEPSKHFLFPRHELQKALKTLYSKQHFTCSLHVNIQHVSTRLLLTLNTHPPCLTHTQTNMVPRGQPLVDGVRRLGWSWPLTCRSWSPTCILTRWTMRGPSNHHNVWLWPPLQRGLHMQLVVFISSVCALFSVAVVCVYPCH